ncbi:MAG: SMC family ATPase, partial [Desulfobacteraceae bacterium]|nr:SMC family ATPase [Desulfobacteraceae bacterium]
MQILSVSLRNIKAHRDTELRFVGGINVLAGANGAGKSTVFEAIGYALFGVDARDFVGNIERFVAIGARKGEIAVTFAADDGEVYRISRGVGAGARWLLAKESRGLFEVEEHAGAPETEARLKALLGLDTGRSLADQFKLVIGPFQHEFLGPFVLKQPVKRQEAFDEILGIDAWRKTYKGTSTLLKSAENKIEVLEAEIRVMEEQLTVLPGREGELAGLLARADEGRQTLAGMEEGLQATEKQLAALEVAEKGITLLRTEIQVLANRIRDGEGKIAEQQKRVQEAEQAQAVQEKTRAGREAFNAAEKGLASLRGRERQRRALEKEVAALEQESGRLAQAASHEAREVENGASRLAEEERWLNETRLSLAADEELVQAAIRLPELR